MTTYNQPITSIIQQRFSCRKYSKEPIPAETREQLNHLLHSITTGPFGAQMRFALVAAGNQDGKALRSLGTYGFIQDPNGFVVGALKPGEHNLEEFGYRMEEIILAATDFGLGTCWLGGTFMKSAFARKIDLKPGETIPAILSIGLIENEEQARAGLIRKRVAGGDRRIAWERMFFDGEFGKPVDGKLFGGYQTALEMLRIGPSASNKQPWRVVKQGQNFHFYMQRSPGYRSIFTRLVQIEDMQRLDMGIAMCHFELSATELGLSGKWVFEDPGLEGVDELAEYSVTWRGN
jgi:nitroreductase